MSESNSRGCSHAQPIKQGLQLCGSFIQPTCLRGTGFGLACAESVVNVHRIVRLWCCLCVLQWLDRSMATCTEGPDVGSRQYKDREHLIPSSNQ